jgi:hypothetical protein
MMRHAPLDLGGDVAEQRENFEKMIAAIPLAGDVVTATGTLGGILPDADIRTGRGDV